MAWIRTTGRLMAGILALLAAQTGLVKTALAQNKVNLGYTRLATDIGLYVADKRGYFKAEGLDVNFVLFDSAARMITPAATGDLDVVAGATSAGFYNAVARGIDLRVVADKVSTPPGRTSQTLIVRKALVDSGRFKTLADIKGLKVANSAPGTAAMASLYKMVERAGLKISDVELVSLGFPQQVLALSSGAIDLALPAEPMTTEAVTKGYGVKVITDDEAYPYHQIAVLFYSGKFAKERPEVARKFLKAFLRGVRDHNDALDAKGNFTGPKGEAIIAILNEYTTIKDPAFYRSFPLAFCNPDGTIHLDSLKNDFQVYKEAGLLEGTVDPLKPIDTSFLDAVLKEIGPYKKAN
ncbi:MAG TPA: ABC transporter substrate-binding protein [Beijerinckiaceae bacterium]|jgi:NitT/TauT family transport system substrate-binding protein|nr:ABC transporter substrate-binding protein [Beijerinckiaceae bacterium]